MQLFLLTAVLPALALAGQLSSANPLHQLGKRQSSGCTGTDIPCGDYCIESGYTCCPDKQGGCPSTEYCDLGDNGQYGCCPNGEKCTGDGGVSTDYNYSYSTSDYSSYMTSHYSTDDYTTTSARATHTIAGGGGAGITVGATTTGSGPATVTVGGGAVGNALNNQNGALAAVALGVVALL